MNEFDGSYLYDMHGCIGVNVLDMGFWVTVVSRGVLRNRKDIYSGDNLNNNILEGHYRVSRFQKTSVAKPVT